MKTQTKQWFLYGTLFTALGFSISGNDNIVGGAADLSSQQLAAKPSAEIQSQLKAAAEARKATRENATATTPAPQQDITKAAEAARAAEAAKTTPPTQVEESATSATTETVVPVSAPVSAEQRTNPRGDSSAARSNGPIAATTEDHDVFVDGHDYKVKLITANGQTTVIYSEKPEGSDCKDECGKSPRVEVIDGEMGSNIAAIKDKLRQQIIPKDIHHKKTTTTQSSTSAFTDDNASSEHSKGLAILRAKIHRRCKHLTKTSSEVSCKSKEFVQLLKADKKSARNKKDKDGNKIARLISDEDAETYFNDEIADGLNEMLTHKFDIQPIEGLTALDQRQLTHELYSEISREKNEARANKREALSLIKSLLRDIDSEYSDTRAAVSGLYETTLRQQADEALSNLSQRNDQIKSQDFAGAQSSFASFLANFDYLRSLNTDLYGTMNDGLNFARRNGLLENDSYRDITREMNEFRAAILKEVINNPSILGTGVNSLDTAISNAARGMRGSGVNSGTVGSGASSLIRQVMTNGGSRGGGRGN